jgi:hypothetical protein
LTAADVDSGTAVVERDKLPPVAETATASLALIVIGGIFLASYAPRRAPLAFPIALAAGSGALLLWNVLTLSRLRRFAWARFFQVARWALVAYVVSAGMLEYVFIYDDVPGSELAVLTVMLVLFAVDVPLIIAYTVARYEQVRDPGT